MLPETGRVKISASVIELLRFMAKQYHKIVSDAMRRIVGTGNEIGTEPNCFLMCDMKRKGIEPCHGERG
jgi:hypothetical protein